MFNFQTEYLMKKIILLIFLFPVICFAQRGAQGNIRLGNIRVFVMCDNEKGPYKAYQQPEDCINFFSKHPNEKINSQDAYLYYRFDSTRREYIPSWIEICNDIQRPMWLEDNELAKGKVYVLMSENFDFLIDYVYEYEDDCIMAANKWGGKYFEVDYYYRDKRSYDILYEKRIKFINDAAK
jgi:hypothetical protein